MKINRRLQRYGNKVVEDLMSADSDGVKEIRDRIANVNALARGVFEEIGREHSTETGVGEAFVDYAGIRSRLKTYISRIRVGAESEYKGILSVLKKTRKQIYYQYRDELNAVLKDIGMSVTTEAVGTASLTFDGSPSKSFTRHLRNQLRAGHDPAALIVTVSQEHVKLIQQHMMTAISKGESFKWARNRVVREMLPADVDKSIKQVTEYNVTRIMRTSYMQAVNNDTSELVQNNSEVLYGSRRVADGRPCLACVVLDGKFYPPDKLLVDHPNGQCILVPMPYPLEYLTNGEFKSNTDQFDEPLVAKLHRMSDKDQQRVFGNKSLWRLWKEEQFDLNALPTGKFGTTMTYAQANTRIAELGGMSSPSTRFYHRHLARTLNPVMDPIDRKNPMGLAIRQKPPDVRETVYDMLQVSDGTDFMSSSAPIDMKARAMALYGDKPNIHWTMFNERARMFHLRTRMDKNGNLYYMYSKDQETILRKMLEPKVPKPKLPTAPKSLNETITNTQYMQLDTGVDLVEGKGLDKIKWQLSPDEEVEYALVNVDAGQVDNQVLRFHRLWDEGAEQYYYGVEFRLTEGVGSQYQSVLENVIKEQGTAFGRVTKFDGSTTIRHHGLFDSGITEKKLMRSEWSSYGRKNDRYLYTVPTENGSFKLEFYGRPLRDQRSDILLQGQLNKVYIDFPTGMDFEKGLAELMQVLEDEFQLSKEMLKPLTEKARRAYSANRVSWADRTSVSASSDVIDKITGEIHDNYTAPVLKLPDEVLDKADTLVHHTYQERIPDLLDSGSLLSNDVRASRGIGSQYTGDSVIEDIETGGSNGVFLRIRGTGTEGRGSWAVGADDFRPALVFDKSQLNRLDWYGFERDLYGEAKLIPERFMGREKTILRQFERPTSDNEVVFRHGMSMKNLLRIEVDTEDYRESLVGFLKHRGYDKINGVDVDNFVVVRDPF